MIKISPSVLACDFTRLGGEVAKMEKAGAEMIHLDVMDGHFVPNISFGPPVIASLAKNRGSILFDTHLMISHPLRYIGDYVKAGADIITFHLECEDDPLACIESIHSSGISAGISIKPATPTEALLPYLDKVELVLVMTVEPGFGGQRFMADMLPKIETISTWRKDRDLDFDLQVDGGIDNNTAPLVAAHGANVLVAGSSLFSQQDYNVAVAQLRKSAEIAAAK